MFLSGKKLYKLQKRTSDFGLAAIILGLTIIGAIRYVLENATKTNTPIER